MNWRSCVNDTAKTKIVIISNFNNSLFLRLSVYNCKGVIMVSLVGLNEYLTRKYPHVTMAIKESLGPSEYEAFLSDLIKYFRTHAMNFKD